MRYVTLSCLFAILAILSVMFSMYNSRQTMQDLSSDISLMQLISSLHYPCASSGLTQSSGFASIDDFGEESLHPIANDQVFLVVDEMPRFPGCRINTSQREQLIQCSNQKLLEFIHSRLRYPPDAKGANIRGTVVLQFIVEPDGLLTNVDVIRDIGYGCGAEAARVVFEMNDMNERWIPGKQDGIPVRVQYTVPIRFKV